MRILMILIPDGDPPVPAGDPILRLERFIGPFYAFREAGAELVLASPAGGFPWMGLARDDRNDTDIVRRFKADRQARDDLTETLRLDQIYADEFDAAFCIGLAGRIWRQGDDNPAGAVIATLLGSGKPVAVIPSNLDFSPLGAAEGLLIICDNAEFPALAARALLGALKT